MYMPHNFSGYPGATCLKCGADDQLEICVMEHNESIRCIEGHVQCEKHALNRCKVHRNKSCPGAEMIKVFHSELKRFSQDSNYKSICPKCDNGVLLIYRDLLTFLLMRQDRCISCGQEFIYQDDNINGEEFGDPN